jgi:hypothetical protein
MLFIHFSVCQIVYNVPLMMLLDHCIYRKQISANKWLIYANSLLMVCCGTTVVTMIKAFSRKNPKALVYYITNYITKNSIYVLHMHLMLQIKIEKIKSTCSKLFSKGYLNKN